MKSLDDIIGRHAEASPTWDDFAREGGLDDEYRSETKNGQRLTKEERENGLTSGLEDLPDWDVFLEQQGQLEELETARRVDPSEWPEELRRLIDQAAREGRCRPVVGDAGDAEYGRAVVYDQADYAYGRVVLDAAKKAIDALEQRGQSAGLLYIPRSLRGSLLKYFGRTRWMHGPAPIQLYGVPVAFHDTPPTNHIAPFIKAVGRGGGQSACVSVHTGWVFDFDD